MSGSNSDSKCAEAFARLIGHGAPAEAEVSIMDVAEWDATGQYKDVVEATRRASQGSDVRVYRVGTGGVRAEYWVVGVLKKGKGGKMVGAKALAVES